jgi:hypothetical protein
VVKHLEMGDFFHEAGNPLFRRNKFRVPEEPGIAVRRTGVAARNSAKRRSARIFLIPCYFPCFQGTGGAGPIRPSAHRLPGLELGDADRALPPWSKIGTVITVISAVLADDLSGVTAVLATAISVLVGRQEKRGWPEQVRP